MLNHMNQYIADLINVIMGLVVIVENMSLNAEMNQKITGARG
jgi:hypothetical protein